MKTITIFAFTVWSFFFVTTHLREVSAYEKFRLQTSAHIRSLVFVRKPVMNYILDMLIFSICHLKVVF